MLADLASWRAKVYPVYSVSGCRILPGAIKVLRKFCLLNIVGYKFCKLQAFSLLPAFFFFAANQHVSKLIIPNKHTGKWALTVGVQFQQFSRDHHKFAFWFGQTVRGTITTSSGMAKHFKWFSIKLKWITKLRFLKKKKKFKYTKICICSIHTKDPCGLKLSSTLKASADLCITSNYSPIYLHSKILIWETGTAKYTIS